MISGKTRIIFGSAAAWLWLAGQAFAIPVTFQLGAGGAIGYAGGAGPLVVVGEPVSQAASGVGTVPISGGALNFATGSFSSASVTSTGFSYIFDAGGLLTISGDIAGDSDGDVILLAGVFGDPSVFVCCGDLGGLPGAAFSGLLSPTVMNPALAGMLGFDPIFGTGTIQQVEVLLAGQLSSDAEGGPFVFAGVPVLGTLTVEPVSVPEASSLVLLACGLLCLVAWRRGQFGRVGRGESVSLSGRGTRQG